MSRNWLSKDEYRIARKLAAAYNRASEHRGWAPNGGYTQSTVREDFNTSMDRATRDVINERPINRRRRY